MKARFNEIFAIEGPEAICRVPVQAPGVCLAPGTRLPLDADGAIEWPTSLGRPTVRSELLVELHEGIYVILEKALDWVPIIAPSP